MVSKPKGYLADTGLICQGQRISSAEALGGHPLLGALFETAVVSDIRRQASALALSNSAPERLSHLPRTARITPVSIRCSLGALTSRLDGLRNQGGRDSV